jgi:ABC-2 type transport system permease protein
VLTRSIGSDRADRWSDIDVAFVVADGSGFVPTEGMPVGLRWFAEYQPFTSIIETLRGLLLGTPIGNNAIFAIAWCVAITLAGYLWAKRLYNRDPVR